MGVDQGQWRNMLPTTRGDPLVELGGATSERTKHEAFSHPNWKPL